MIPLTSGRFPPAVGTAFSHNCVGDGEFDNLGQIRAMLKDGYKGTFTLEAHWADPKGIEDRKDYHGQSRLPMRPPIF